MLKRSRDTSLLALILIAIICVVGGEARASEPFYWEYINVDIDVQENGDMWVTEVQRYVFTAPHTNQRYRWLPLDNPIQLAAVDLAV